MNNENRDTTGDKLASDFKAVVLDAEALIRATANQSDEKITEIRAKAEESVRNAKIRLSEMQKDFLQKTEQAAKATNVYVHEYPWQSLGVAASFGLIVGFLICRR